MCKQYTCSCEFILMIISSTYKFIIVMLICYVTIKLLRQICLLISSIVAYTELHDFTWTHCAICLFNTAWFIHMLLLIGLTYWHTHQARENLSQTLLHTVSRKLECAPDLIKQCQVQVKSLYCDMHISCTMKYTHRPTIYKTN